MESLYYVGLGKHDEYSDLEEPEGDGGADDENFDDLEDEDEDKEEEENLHEPLVTPIQTPEQLACVKILRTNIAKVYELSDTAGNKKSVSILDMLNREVELFKTGGPGANLSSNFLPVESIFDADDSAYLIQRSL